MFSHYEAAYQKDHQAFESGHPDIRPDIRYIFTGDIIKVNKINMNNKLRESKNDLPFIFLMGRWTRDRSHWLMGHAFIILNTSYNNEDITYRDPNWRPGEVRTVPVKELMETLETETNDITRFSIKKINQSVAQHLVAGPTGQVPEFNKTTQANTPSAPGPSTSRPQAQSRGGQPRYPFPQQPRRNTISTSTGSILDRFS